MRWRTVRTGEPDSHPADLLAGLEAIVWMADAEEGRLAYVSDGCRAPTESK